MYPVSTDNLTILQILPNLNSGGVERGTVEMVKACTDVGFQALVVSNGGKMVSEIENCGGTHLTLPVHSKNPLKIFINAIRLARIIRQYEVDLVHARSRAPAWVAYFACRMTDCHFITTIHGTHSGRFFLKRWYNAVMLKGEKIIAVSEFVKTYALKHFCANKHEAEAIADKIQVIHRGADIEYFNPGSVNKCRIAQMAEYFNIPNDSDVVLLPGRFTSWKGQEVLIKAIKFITERQGLFFVLLGDLQQHPKYIKRLLDLADREGVSECIVLRNNVRDIPAAYMLASVVLSTSTKPEAFGRVAIEACAMGKPIIATNIGGSTETIVEEQTGFLVDPNNPKQLADKITAVLHMDKAQINRMREHAIIHIREHFSLTKMCNETLKLYLAVLSHNVLPEEDDSAN